MTTTREPTKRVKNTKLKETSRRWMQRHLNDPYVQKAQMMGYRSRAAFKLIQLDEKLKILKPGLTVVDLGSAPGGWSQVLSERHSGKIVAIDILPMDELAGVDFLQMDFSDNAAPDKLFAMLDGHQADVVVSDLAPNTTGHKQTDHLRLIGLIEMAADFACKVLKQDGHFVAKVFQGGAEGELLNNLKLQFKQVKHIKPAASRSESAETYICCLNYRGDNRGYV